MTRIYLVRHAEAEGNLYRRIHGWYDSLITDNGYRQIAALEGRFAPIHIDAVYSSDLFRTRTTASAVWRAKDLPLNTTPGLREIHMGVWEDQTWGEVARLDGEQLRRHNAMDPTWRTVGAETFDEVRARMERTLRAIAAKHPGQTVAAFSHGTAIRNALAVFHGLSVAESARLGHSDNTAVSLLEFDGDKVRILFENDNSHLPEEISTLARQSWWKDDGRSIGDHNFWYRPMAVGDAEAEDYVEARREAWLTVHGCLEGFEGRGFLEKAQRAAAEQPWSVVRVMLKDRPAGVLQLDLDRDAGDGAGWISLYYLDPETRCQGMGVQLLGQAVTTVRPLGRDRLRLACAPSNGLAQRFYGRCGFRKVGSIRGARQDLDVLEKYVGYQEPWA